MSNEVPAALESPRVEEEVLKWYEGDAFEISWTMALLKDEEPYTYLPEDKLVWCFYSRPGRALVHKFEFTNIPSTSTCLLQFTKEISKKFPAGHYYYCLKFYDSADDCVTTLYAENEVEVERCH